MRTTLASLSLLSTALIACSDEPPPPSEVRARIAEDLRYVLTEGKAALDGGTANLPTGAAFGFATQLLGDGPAARLQAFDASDDGFDVDGIVQALNERLFTDANYLGNGLFKVPADLVCKDETTTVIDSACAQRLTQAQLRIRVADDDGMRFWLQVSANHDEPLGIVLRHDEIALTVNLDDATDAMVALAQLFGEEAPNADLRGQITGSLKILGKAHGSASLTFDRALSIKVAEQGVGLDSDGALRFASAAANVFTLQLVGEVQKADLDVGLGETTVHIPADGDDPSTDVFLAGATVKASYQGNTLRLQNISLGDRTTTVSMGGQQAIAIDLNAADGRKLNATIIADQATGAEMITVTPRFDLQTSIDRSVLGDEPEVYDVTRVRFDGSLRGTGDGELLEVVSGTFSIETNPAQYGVSATAGQCVLATEVYDDTTLSSWTEYSVGACP